MEREIGFLLIPQGSFRFYSHGDTVLYSRAKGCLWIDYVLIGASVHTDVLLGDALQPPTCASHAGKSSL